MNDQPTLTLEAEDYADPLTAPMTTPEQPLVPFVESLPAQAPEQPVAIQEGPGALLSAIYRLAQNNDVRMDVLTFLFDRQKEEEERQRRQLYLQALRECQEAIKPVARDAENKQTKSYYAKLETIDAAIRPIYTGRGFVLTFNQVKADNAGHVKIQCACSHGPSGHTEFYEREGPLDDKGPKGGEVKTQLHGQVSTETYLQRQLVKGIFNVQLAGHDDDGNKGGLRPLTEEQQEQLLAALKEANRNEGKFLSTMVSNARTVEEVDQKDFDRLMNVLALAIDQRKAKGETQ